MSIWSIYRRSGGAPRLVASCDTLEYHDEWMGDSFVTVTVKSAEPIDFQIGDYVEYRNGEMFSVNYDPNIIKKACSGSYGEGFVYENVRLYPDSVRLKEIEFKDVVLNTLQDNANKLVYSSMATFSFFASSVEDLADRIQANLNRVESGVWTVLTPNRPRSIQRKSSAAGQWGDWYEGDGTAIIGKTDVNISADGLYCWDALKLSYTAFDLSFFVSGTTIIIGGKAIASDHDFRYGKGLGLYQIERTFDDSQKIVTKLFSYGSERNLPTNYYANLHKKPYVTGHKETWQVIMDEPIYSVLTDIQWETVSGKVERNQYVTVSDGTVKCTAWLDYRGLGADYDDKYFRVNFMGDGAEAFYNRISDGQMIFFVTGVNVNTWPYVYNSAEGHDNYPALLSINRLMLPGFPDDSLYAWVLAHGGTPVDAPLNDSKTGAATWKNMTAYFSKDKTDPWLMSRNAEKIGIREGSLNFSDGDDEIYPTIEGTGYDEVNWAEQMDDNGYLDGDDATFKMMPQQPDGDDGGIEWNYSVDTVSVSMKDGYCVGREFKVSKAARNDVGLWELTLERAKDESLGVYFPYKYGNSGLYQVIGRGNAYGHAQGDKFVVLGIPLPQRFVEIAASKLLERSLQELSKKDHQQFTYVPKIDEIYMKRQDDAVKEERDADTYGTVSLHDTLHAGMQMVMSDEDLNLDGYRPFIDTLTIKEDGNNGIPTYDVVLRDEKELTMSERIQSQIEGGVSGMVNVIGGGGISEAELERIGRDLFLSKTGEDTTEYLIRFLGGLIVERFFRSEDFSEGEWSPEGENDGRGFGAWKDSGYWHMELDYATVRELLRTKEALMEMLSVNKSAEIGSGVIVDESEKILPSLKVNGHSEFTHDLYSSDFISQFIGGNGWSIQRKTRTNVAGVEETYYELEIDNITVRNLLRVYEFVVSQLRGENDNYMFAAFLKVHHYDPETGKVWLQTEQGKFYNPFWPDDCIVVQQYQGENDAKSGGDGYITKHYELVITDSGVGGEEDKDENGDRLDWVTFKNFQTDMEGGSPLSLIKKDDTFVRKDNLTNPDRKGVIQIITVGPNTPYMDVDYGLVTHPNDALKARIGKLDGVKTEQFGKLEGFGAYINNLYSVGRMLNHQTGERYSSQFEVTNERFRSVYKETTYDTSGNFLSNGEFQSGLESWSHDPIYGSDNPEANEQKPISDSNGSIYINGELLATQHTSKVEATIYDGISVLRLNGCAIKQAWTDMADNNGTHEELITDDTKMPTASDYEKEYREYYQDPNDVTKKKINPATNKEYTEEEITAATAAARVANNTKESEATVVEEQPDAVYLGVRMMPVTQGDLTVSIISASGVEREILKEYSVAQSIEWKVFKASDNGSQTPWTWDTEQNGYVKVKYTGECLLRFVTLQNDPFDDMSVTYQTLIEQNARRILLEARKIEAQRTLMAGITIQHNAITNRVTTNEAADKKYIYDLLGITINSNGTYTFPEGWVPDEHGKYDFSSWRIQTAGRIDDIVGKWDEYGNLIGYSERTQTSDYIRSIIASQVAQGDDDYPQWVIDLFEQYKNFIAKWNEVCADHLVYDSERVALYNAYTLFNDKLTVAAANINALPGGKKNDLIKGQFKEVVKPVNTHLGTVITNFKNSEDGKERQDLLSELWFTCMPEIQNAIDVLFDNIYSSNYYGEMKEAVAVVAGNLENYQESLDDAIQSANPGMTFVNWLGDTSTSYVKVLGVLDSSGNLKDFSTVTQTATAISTAVTAEKNRIDGVLTRDYSTTEQTATAISTSVNELDTKVISIADTEKWEARDVTITAGKTFDQIKTQSSNVRILYKDLIPVTEYTAVSLNEGYSVMFVYFNASKKVCSGTTNSGYKTVEKSGTKVVNNNISIKTSSQILPQDIRYVAIVMKRDNGSAIATSAVQSSGISLIDTKLASTSYVVQTADSITSTVTNNKAAADAAFKKLDEETIPGLESDIGDVDTKASESATWISQNKTRIALISGQFDKDGNLTNTSGLVTGNGSFATLFAEAVEEDGIAHTADLSVYVEKDTNNNIVSGIKMSADQLNFNAKDIFWNLGKQWTVLNKNNATLLHLDADGNLSIRGQITALQTNLNVTQATVASLLVFDNASQLKWKDTTSKALSMLTLDGSNQFVVGENLTNADTSGDDARQNDNNYRLYLRGTKIIFQTGYGNSGSKKYGDKATLTSDGVFEINAIKIGDTYIGYDSNNGALKVYKISNGSEIAGNLYTKGWLSAFGVGSTSGGGSVELTAIAKSINDNPVPGWTTSSEGVLYKSSGLWNTKGLSEFVQVTGTQTITGRKTFTKAITFNGGNFGNIHIETDSDGNYSSSRNNEINNYSGNINLQYNSTQNVTLCVGGGSVGVGTSVQSGFRFAVNGNSKVQGQIGIKYDPDTSDYNTLLFVNGVSKGRSWSNLSDIRRKDVKSDVDGLTVEDVAGAPVFRFSWKDGEDKDVHVGTSAQYWQERLPEAVSEGQYLSMDYGATALASAVITARKVVEQEKEIKALKEEVAELKELVKQLMSR